MIAHLSERALILAPSGRDAEIAGAMLREAQILSFACASVPDLVQELESGAGLAIITEEALENADLQLLSRWIGAQPEWSDFPFILLTFRGGGLERNPAARRYLEMLGNVTLLERPFHPTTLISLADSARRARRRQYEARSRLEQLNESERQFRMLANSIPTLCWMANPDGRVFWYNRQWYDYTGTTLEEMTSRAWRSVHDPQILPEVLERWSESLSTGTPFEMVFPIKSAEGVFRPFLTRVQPVRDAQGAIVRWFGTNTDILPQQEAEAALRQLAAELETRVEQRTAEREAALAQLHEAQKLETLGQLTGGVAHDFNNLLTPIIGALDMLQRKPASADPRTARLVGNALLSAERAKTLVQRLLGFARRQALQTVAVDIQSLLHGMSDLISSSIGPTVSLHLDCQKDLPSALADPNQLELAILNLCVNARDAMPGGGDLTVAADLSCIEDSSSTPKLPSGTYVRISVMDSGAGMDPDTLGRAIEPFFSTKEAGRGTGLGLSMVHGLAAQLGGGFVLNSTPGQGTRADLLLPVTSEISSNRPFLKSAASASSEQPLSILLVDDEALVRQGTGEMLRELGHGVTEAGGATEAMAVLAAGKAIDLVVTDYKMPDVDGAELARRIRKSRPDMPVLLISGYTGVTEASMDLPRLDKPFGLAELADALRNVEVGGGSMAEAAAAL